MKRVINDEEINFFKHIVAIYFYLKNRVFEYDIEINRLREKYYEIPNRPPGVSFDRLGSGCSVSFPKSSPLDRLREEKLNAECERYNVIKQIQFLDVHYQISNRYNRLNDKYKNVIREVYIEMRDVSEAASRLQISNKKRVYTLINKAIIQMLKMKEEDVI